LNKKGDALTKRYAPASITGKLYVL